MAKRKRMVECGVCGRKYKAGTHEWCPECTSKPVGDMLWDMYLIPVGVSLEKKVDLRNEAWNRRPDWIRKIEEDQMWRDELRKMENERRRQRKLINWTEEDADYFRVMRRMIKDRVTAMMYPNFYRVRVQDGTVRNVLLAFRTGHPKGLTQQEQVDFYISKIAKYPEKETFVIRLTDGDWSKPYEAGSMITKDIYPYPGS